MAERQRFLNDRERETFAALARTAIPEGRLFPAADERALVKVEGLFAGTPDSVRRIFKVNLRLLENATLLRYGRPFSKLSTEKRLRTLEAANRNEAGRLWLRALLTPLKTAHYGDRKIYERLGCRFAVEPPAHPEEFRWRQNIMNASDFDADEEIECDAVVIGTGAGGAPVANALAEKGYAVLMLEQGKYFTRDDFNGRAMEMQRKLYHRGGFFGSIGNTFIPIPVGKTVGGTTTINSGTCYRVPESVLGYWRNELGLTELTAEHMDRYYSPVEEMLGVEDARMKYVGPPGEVIAEGCEALGFKHNPLKRNAPECDGQGLCCFGCPTDAKRSSNVSWVPAALKSNAHLMTRIEVGSILVENGRAVGVVGRARSADGKAITITVKAKVVVLSAGTMFTPTLLMKNGLLKKSPALGKNLSIHPAVGMMALWDREIRGWNYIPQGYAIEEFHDEGILFEGATTPLEFTAAGVTMFGPKYVEVMEQANRMSMFGFMVKDSTRGQVRLGPDGGPLIWYWMNKKDTAKLLRGTEILARVFFAAGAKRVFPSLWRFEQLNSLKDVERMARANVKPRHFDISAYHPLGTARMGIDPKRSVVGPTQETHEIQNLWICDGSAVPSSLGVNPQMTIMAFSLRAADFIGERLESMYARESAA